MNYGTIGIVILASQLILFFYCVLYLVIGFLPLKIIAYPLAKVTFTIYFIVVLYAVYNMYTDESQISSWDLLVVVALSDLLEAGGLILLF